MKRIVAAFCAFLASTSLAQAAGTALSALSAGGAVSGTDLFYNVQTAGAGGVKSTATQIATFMWASPALTGTPTSPTITLGTASTTTGTLVLANSASANLTTIQAGNAAAARVYTWPTNFGAAGTALTDAAGNGTLSWVAYAPTASPTFTTQVNLPAGSASVPGLRFAGDNTGWFQNAASQWTWAAASSAQLSIISGQFRMQGSMVVCWTAADSTSGCDTGVSRDAAGTVDIGNGNAGDSSGTLKAAHLTATSLANSATTSAVCYNTGTGVITYDGTIGTCTVSALWHKNLLGVLDRADDPLSALRPIIYTYRQNGDGIGDDRTHVGLAADDVALMDSRCVAYDAQGRLSNYEDRCILAYLVADRAKMRAEVDELKSALKGARR